MFQYQYAHPAVTVDIVVFSIRDEQLKLLLIRRALAPFRGQWALPGGFVQMEEDLEQAARRELQEETGVTDIFLEQLFSYGNPDRDPRERVISITYFALIPSDRIVLQAATDAEEADWFALDRLPQLAFDHATIVADAQQRLRAKLEYSTLAFQFLAESFTLMELQKVYETILLKPQDKRNFRKWILALNQIEETGDMKREGAHRPAKTYRVKAPGQVRIIR